ISNRLIDDVPTQMGKTAKYLWQQFAPANIFIPGSYYQDKLINASTGATDWLGRDYSVMGALFSSMGIKMVGHNVEGGRMSHMFEARQVQRELRQRLYRASRELQRNMISESAYRKVVERTQKDMAKLSEKVQGLN
ncbi:MAG: hypothetical protein ACPGO7_04885, partial [Alphaproteobacteria bacterium]